VNVVLEPGDDILFECTYDNPSATTDKWGAGLKDQMCVATLRTRTEGPLAVAACLDSGSGEQNAPSKVTCPVDTFGGLFPEAPREISFTASERQTFFAYQPYVPPPCAGSSPWLLTTEDPWFASTCIRLCFPTELLFGFLLFLSNWV